MRNAKFYPWLLPYLDDDLDAARRARLESLLAADPALAAEAERLRRTRARLQAASTPLANAAPPADAWRRLRARLEPTPVPPRPVRAWWLAGAGATAAAGLVIGALWLPGLHTPDVPRPARTGPGLSAPRAPRAAGPSAEHAGSVNALAPPTLMPRPSAPTRPLTPAIPSPPPKSKPLPVAADPFALPSAGNASGPMTGRVAVARPPVPLHAPSVVYGTFGNASSPMNASGSMAGGVAVARSSVPAPPFSTYYAPPAAAPALVPPPPVPTERDENGQDASTVIRDGPVSSASNGVQVQQQTKSQPNNLYQAPGLVSGQSKAAHREAAAHGDVTAKRRMFAHAAPLRASGAGAEASAGNTQNALDALDGWQSSLAAAMQPPLWGEDAGMQQANQALLAAKEAGALDDLRARLEARRTQAPRDVATGRMLAAVYDFGFASENALRERRRIAGLEGAGGEDWYALARAEEGVGNNAAARAAYRRALESPTPPTPFHAAVARQRQ